MEVTMKELAKKIESNARAMEFSGVVSIFAKNEIIYHSAFGYRDVKNKVANATETRFCIASGTKLFTALGIGKLIERQEFSLHTRVSEIYPQINSFIDPNATVMNLLTHTSGIFDYFDEEIIEDFDNYSVEIPWFQLTTPSDYLPLFDKKPMKFLPGERFSYSNGGYVFLGILIEQVSNMTYRDFIEAEVLHPAGMTDSGFFAFNDLPTNTANGYLADNKTTNIYNVPICGGGDGGMYTTSADLREFWNNFFAFQVLPKELTETFLATQHVFNDISGYGCGLYKKLDNSSFAIMGSDAGMGFDSRYLENSATVINILSNRTDGEVEMRKLILEYLA
jgi:CubicO group peptidase (beta-lactamase class C family)